MSVVRSTEVGGLKCTIPMAITIRASHGNGMACASLAHHEM